MVPYLWRSYYCLLAMYCKGAENMQQSFFGPPFFYMKKGCVPKSDFCIRLVIRSRPFLSVQTIEFFIEREKIKQKKEKKGRLYLP